MFNFQSSGQAVDRGFVRLAFGGVVVTLLMIVVGAITRTTESGMGCGTYWLTCNGQLIPELDHYTTVIEFGHRIFALFVGAFGLAVFVKAFRQYRENKQIFYPALAIMGLFVTQTLLGMVTVKLSNQWVSVLLHLGCAMLLLAAFVVTWTNARASATPNIQSALKSAPTMTRPSLRLGEVMVAIVLALLVAMVGAAVQGNGATYACVGYPLCFGELWPERYGPLQTLNMAHRIVAGALGVATLYMLWRARYAAPTIRTALWLTLVLYLAQATIGAGVVLLTAQGELVKIISQTLHVIFAAATWSTFIVVGTLVWLQQRSIPISQHQSGALTTSSATTSN